MMQLRSDEHVADVRNIAEGDEVRLHLSTGETIRAVCNRKTRHHEEGVNIVVQKDWYLVDEDGTEYNLCIIDGLSGTEGDSPFPTHFPLYVPDEIEGAITEDNSLGYVEDVDLFGPNVTESQE